MPARWGTSAGVPRTSTPPSRSAARWCAGTGSWCRLAPGSWPTRIRHASSGRPRTRRRPCSRRWRSPRPEGEVYLAPVFKLLSTTGEQSIDLQPGRNIVVGRAVTSDVPIYDPTISRRHAEVSLTDGGVKVKDAGSSNGTFLNGARITEAIAVENDVITFGKVAFRVKEVSAPAARPQVVPSVRSEEHTSELQSPVHLVCRLLLEKKNMLRHYSLNVMTSLDVASRANTPIFI